MEVSRCGPGNAVYDSGIDAIFVHRDLAVAATGEEWTTDKLYFVFLLLHELGHRDRHGGERRMFDEMSTDDLDPELDIFEQEADGFAFERLQDLYKSDLATEQPVVGDVHRRTVGLLDRPIPNEDRLWNDIFLLTREFFPNLLSSSERFTPLHRDRSHPTIVRRFARFLEVISERGIASEEIRQRLALNTELLQRLDAMQQRPTCELLAGEAVAHFHGTAEHLYLLTSHGTAYRAALDEIRSTLDSSSHSIIRLSSPAIGALPKAVGYVMGVWGASSLHVVTHDGAIYRESGSTWRASGTLELSHTARLVSSWVNPADPNVLCASWESHGERASGLPGRGFARIEAGGAHEVRSLASYRDAVSRAAGLRNPGLALTGVWGPGLVLAVFEDGERDFLTRPWGLALVSPESLEVVDILPLSMPDDCFPESIVVFGDSASPKVLAVGMGPDIDHFEWGAWMVSPETKPELIGTHRHVADSFRTDLGPLNRAFDPRLRDLTALGGDLIGANFYGDCTYLIDTKRREISTLFYPGGGLVRGVDGLVVVLPSFGPNPSARCYAILPGITTPRPALIRRWGWLAAVAALLALGTLARSYRRPGGSTAVS